MGDVMNIVLIISIIAFIVVILAAFLIYLYISSKLKSKAFKARIEQDSASEVSTGTHNRVKERVHLKQSFTNIASTVGNIAPPKSLEDASLMRRDLVSIGYRGNNAVSVFTGIRIICALVLPAILYVSMLVTATHMVPLNLMILCLILAFFAYFLPILWLRIKIAKRQEKLLDGFPDAVDMLVVCVEAGMGMDAAIDRVGTEIGYENDALSNEFTLYNKEMRLGKTRTQALKDLALRTGLDEMKSLTTLLLQTDKFGTSVAQALRVHSEFLRVQRYQRAEERAAKLTVKLVIPLIFCMFPSVFIVILGPAIINAIRLNQ
jgi:tight adherence protein C